MSVEWAASRSERGEDGREAVRPTVGEDDDVVTGAEERLLRG